MRKNSAGSRGGAVAFILTCVALASSPVLSSMDDESNKGAVLEAHNATIILTPARVEQDRKLWPWRGVIGTVLLISLSSTNAIKTVFSKYNNTFWLRRFLAFGSAIINVGMAVGVIIPKATSLSFDAACDTTRASQIIVQEVFAAMVGLMFHVAMVFVFQSCKDEKGIKESEWFDQHTAKSEVACLRVKEKHNIERSMHNEEYNSFNSVHNSRTGSPMLGNDCQYDAKVWLIYTFLYAVFFGVAVETSQAWNDGVILVTFVMALLHGLCEVDLAYDTAWSLRLLLTFGGVFIAYGSSRIAGSILAFAGGLYVYICSKIVVSNTKALIAYCNSEHDQGEKNPTDLSYSLRNIGAYHQYQYGDEPQQHCLSCKKLGTSCPIKLKDSSLPISIPLSNYSIQGDESDYRLAKEYDCATWTMYHRIMSAREKRARCGICFGPMKDNESTTVILCQVVNSGKKQRESKHLNKEEMSLLNVQAHRECHHGETGDHDCLQFQLD